MLKITKGLKPRLEGDCITQYTDDEGGGLRWVRVKMDGEDFCIALHDYTRDKRYCIAWDDAMESSKEEGWSIFNKEQAALYDAYREEIDKKLKALGGVTLKKDYYWTSTEIEPDEAWIYNNYSESFISFEKRTPCRVRPILNLSDI